MKNIKFQYLYFSLALMTIFSCQDEVQRDLYPQELTGGFELLGVEKTGIDFNNKINESPTFNHYFYSQMYVGLVSLLAISITTDLQMSFSEVTKLQIAYI